MSQPVSSLIPLPFNISAPQSADSSKKAVCAASVKPNGDDLNLLMAYYDILISDISRSLANEKIKAGATAVANTSDAVNKAIKKGTFDITIYDSNKNGRIDGGEEWSWNYIYAKYYVALEAALTPTLRASFSTVAGNINYGKLNTEGKRKLAENIRGLLQTLPGESADKSLLQALADILISDISRSLANEKIKTGATAVVNTSDAVNKAIQKGAIDIAIYDSNGNGKIDGGEEWSWNYNYTKYYAALEGALSPALKLQFKQLAGEINYNDRDKFNTQAKIVLADKIANLISKKTDPAFCAAPAPIKAEARVPLFTNEARVEPYWITPGSKNVVIKVTGGQGLKRAVNFKTPKPFSDPQGANITDTSLSYPAVDIPEETPPGPYHFELLDERNQKIGEFHVMVVPQGEPRFAIQARQLGIFANAGAGVFGKVGGDKDLSVARIEDKIDARNLSLEAGIKPKIIGLAQDNALVHSEQLELNGETSFSTSFNAHRGDDSGAFNFKLGVDSAYRIIDQFKPGVYFNLEYNGRDYGDPDALNYFNGHLVTERPGLSIGSEWSDLVSSRANFGWRLSQAEIDKESFGYSAYPFGDFQDKSQGVELGGKLRLGMFDEWRSGWPNVEISGLYGRGRHDIPVRSIIAGTRRDSSSEENIITGELELKIDWDKYFSLSLKYSDQNHDRLWNRERLFAVKVGRQADVGFGSWGLEYDHFQDAKYNKVIGSWTDPWLNIITLKPEYGNLRGTSGLGISGLINLYNASEQAFGKVYPEYPPTVFKDTVEVDMSNKNEPVPPPLPPSAPAVKGGGAVSATGSASTTAGSKPKQAPVAPVTKPAKNPDVNSL